MVSVLRKISIACLILCGFFLLTKEQIVDGVTQQTISSMRYWRIALPFLGASFILELIRFIILKKRSQLSGSTVQGEAIKEHHQEIAKQAKAALKGIENQPDVKDKLGLALLHALAREKARIGFHGMRDQKILVEALESAGYRKENFYQDTRDFLRQTLIAERGAFKVLKDLVNIHMVYKGAIYDWDGYGKRCPIDRFYEAEVLYDLDDSEAALFKDVLEGIEV
jgi:hypothetical protein